MKEITEHQLYTLEHVIRSSPKPLDIDHPETLGNLLAFGYLTPIRMLPGFQDRFFLATTKGRQYADTHSKRHKSN